MLFLYISSIIILIGALVNVMVFEWNNYKSVHEFELEYKRIEDLKGTRWKGYPKESETTILRRKLYKVNSLKENEVERIKENREENQIEELER